MIRLVITVEGGVIQDITANDPSDLEILILDLDTDEGTEISAFSHDGYEYGTFYCDIFIMDVNEEANMVNHFFNEYWRKKNE